MAARDPRLDDWREGLARLGALLVDLESHPTVELARAGGLTGGSAATWSQADAGVARAWETYRAVEGPLQPSADPREALARLSAAPVPSPDGPAEPGAALGSALAAVEAALAVAGRLSVAWVEWSARVREAHETASQAGDQATVRAADALLSLLAGDPEAVSAAEVEQIEAAAAEAGRHHAATQAAVARFDADLARARTMLNALTRDLRSADPELDHAASRIAGLGRADPVPDLDRLAAWLDRIVASATGVAGDRARAAGELASWLAAAEARRGELDAAVGAARAAMTRRQDARGLWRALRAKAAARRLDEQADVASVTEAARAELWRAPCDLAAAETALAELATLLNARREGADDRSG